MTFGIRTGSDSWAVTSFLWKHAYVEDFFEGCTVTSTGFTSAFGSTKDLPIVNLLYEYDLSDRTTIILEQNNTIYMLNYMLNLLYNIIQPEENENRVDLIPRD